MSGAGTGDSTRAGGCTCGAVRYRVTGDPLFIHVCHCTDCQRVTGSAFQISTIVETRQLETLSGEPGSVPIVGGSGRTRSVSFCRECGSSVWGTSPSRGPAIMWVQGGTFDDTGWIRPGAHIWTRSKQPWVTIPPDVPAFEQAYVTAEVWPAESIARAERATG